MLSKINLGIGILCAIGIIYLVTLVKNEAQTEAFCILLA